MKQKLLLLFFISFVHITANAQNFNSFYIDKATSWNRVKFSNDAIYFYTSGYLIKTNYEGNIRWVEETPSPILKLEIGSNEIYGFYDSSLFKLDTAGNLMWVRKFTDPIYNGVTFQNSFGDMVFDGSRIYLSFIQNPSSSNDHDYYPSILVIDTSGTILNANYKDISAGGGLGAVSCASSLHGGAWIGYDIQPGFTHHGNLIRINNDGSYDYTANSPSFGFQTYTYVKQILSLPDSTYIVLSNAFNGDNINPLGLFNVSHINEKGNILWQYSYFDSLYTGDFQVMQAESITCDSSKNIYLMGAAQEVLPSGSYNGVFAMKLDSNGTVLFSKFWAKPNPDINLLVDNSVSGAFNYLQYANSHIYWMANYLNKPAIIVFDTSFSNSCYDPDSTITITKNSSQVNADILGSNPISISYTPINDVLVFNSTNLTNGDLCFSLVLGANEESLLNEGIVVFPNPLISSSILRFTSPLNNFEIVIYNVLGEEIMRNKLISNEVVIRKENLESGIYFVKATSKEKQYVQKIIVQ